MIKDIVLRGEPLIDVTVIDVHCHFGAFGSFFVPKQASRDFIKMCDILGVNKTVVSAHMSLSSDCILGNNQIIDLVDQYPGRIYGYAVINPNEEVEPEKELERCFLHKGFIGIKLHPQLHNSKFMANEYICAYEFASSNKCPILFHVWGESQVKEFEEVACNYPEFPKIMGHGGADYHGSIKAIEVANKYKNVYLDTALSFAPQGNIEWLVSEVGSKKVVYGSDFQFYDPRLTIGRIAMADITDVEK